MIRVLLTIFLVAVVCASAWADLTIPELKLRKKGADINVRVVLRNPDRATVRGPVKVTLWVAPDQNSPWQEIKVWTNIAKVASGEKVARDFFRENDETLQEVGRNPEWAAKVRVEAPGQKPVEKIEVFSGEAP